MKINSETDTIVYVGDIKRYGYNLLSNVCKKHKKNSDVCLILITFGGDPDAGFRIARALQHYYNNITIMIPSACKSAGTLICTGANELLISDEGELGPLDIQMSKSTELFESTSGLDLPQAFTALESKITESLKNTLIEMRMGGKLSTKIAAEIATNLVTGIYAPIYEQIDPLRVGEMQRATMIAYRYGQMLADKGKNITLDGISKLLLTYPSHGFVIDRKEAKTIFKNVHRTCDDDQLILDKINCNIGNQYLTGASQDITCFNLDLTTPEKENENNHNPECDESEDTTGSSATNERPAGRPKKDK